MQEEESNKKEGQTLSRVGMAIFVFDAGGQTQRVRLRMKGK